MPYLRVVYRKRAYLFDYVSSQVLDGLILREEISHFYRPMDKEWVNVKLDLIRGTGGKYDGPERRMLELESMLKKKEIYPRWLGRFCDDLERPE